MPDSSDSMRLGGLRSAHVLADNRMREVQYSQVATTDARSAACPRAARPSSPPTSPSTDRSRSPSSPSTSASRSTPCAATSISSTPRACSCARTAGRSARRPSRGPTRPRRAPAACRPGEGEDRRARRRPRRGRRVVMLNAGTTTLAVARHLRNHRDLTIATNNLRIPGGDLPQRVPRPLRLRRRRAAHHAGDHRPVELPDPAAPSSTSAATSP